MTPAVLPSCPFLCVACAVTGTSNPARVRGANCLLEALASRGAARTGREAPQPNTNPFQPCFARKCGHVMQNFEGKQRARKPPLRWVWGVNPKSSFRIVGVVGAGLHADASAR